MALTVQGVSYAYGPLALQLPDIDLSRGDTCAVVGPSGSGKSTLLHLIAGLLTPAQGSVTVDGQRMDTLPQSQRDRLRGKAIGMVLQQLRLIRALPVLDNLLLAQRLAGQTPDRDAALERLNALGLSHRVRHRPPELSQGEAQRVAIARALLGKPALILADEPTSALDDGNAKRVLDLLVDQAKTSNAGLLIVTHDSRIRGQLNQQIQLEPVKQAPEAA